MSEKDSLQILVQSLTSDELKFIEKFARNRRRKPQKALDLLRDMLAENFSWDELKTKHKNLNITRFQLKQLIIQALRLVDKESGISQKIMMHLHNESIYYRKGVYEEAAKELSQAEELSRGAEESGLLLL